MATNSVVLAVDVQLQTTQSSINQLKKSLEGIGKDTMLFHGLRARLSEIERDFQRVSTAAKNSFSSKKELNAFQAQFDDLVGQIQDAARSFENIDLKNIDLESVFGKGQADAIARSIENVDKAIQRARENLEKFEQININEKLADNAQIREAVASLNSALPTLQLDIKTEGAEASLQKLNDTAVEVGQTLRNLQRDYSKFSGSQSVYTERVQGFTQINRAISGSTSAAESSKILQDLLGKQSGSSINERAQALAQYYGFSQEEVSLVIQMIEKGSQEIQNKLRESLTSSEEYAQTQSRTKGEETRRRNQLAEIGAQITEQQNLLQTLNNLRNQIQGKQNEILSSPEYSVLIKQSAQEKLARENLIKTLKEEVNARLSAESVAKSMGTANAQVVTEIQRQTEALNQLNAAQKQLNSIRNTIEMFFGLHRVINLTRNAVVNAFNQIKTLDSVMTEIAVVTNMTQQDLWGSIGEYSAIAQQYAVATEGVYRISQIYYQQGLSTVEVNRLTTETLKMAKVANIDYADAADYMTVAIRSFNMEMSEAQRVTDVYSALAAKTASTTEELAIAMSKTASGAANVGSSFEATSAMLSTMISVTRESAQNLGSALKSIVSRYGEMTKNPLSLMDEDGNIASLNKVDTALQSIGISIHDANGEFRDFDDVILELAQSWDTVDKNTQRWIATTLAGNRQQSRFLALVSNGEYYARALKIAESAQDSATLQTLKTLDSLESKIQQVKVSLEQFYSSMEIEKVIKGVLTTVNTVIKNINKMAKPQALVTLFNLFNGLKNIALGLFSAVTGEINKVRESLDKLKAEALSKLEANINTDSATQKVDELGEHLTETIEKPRTVNIETSVSGQPSAISKAYTQEQIQSALSLIPGAPQGGKKISPRELAGIYGLKEGKLGKGAYGEKIQAIIPPEIVKQLVEEKDKNKLTVEEMAKLIYEKLPEKSGKPSEETPARSNWWIENPDKAAQWGMIAQSLGTAITALGLTFKDTSNSAWETSKVVAGLGNTMTGLGSAFATAARYGFSTTGIILGLVSALPSLITGITQFFDGVQKTAAEKTQMLEEEFQAASDSSLVAKGKASELKSSIDQLKMLRDAQYDSADASKEYLDYMNQMADTYPTLVAQYDSAGNAILSVEAAEQLLIEARRTAAVEATNAAKKELELRDQQKQNYEQAKDTLESILSQGEKTYDLSRLEDVAYNLGYGEELVTSITNAFGNQTGSAEALATSLAKKIKEETGTTDFDATQLARGMLNLMESDQGTIKGRGYADDEISGMAKQLNILIDEYSITAEDLGLEKGDIETQLRNAKDLPALIELIYKRVETKLGYLDNQLTSVEDSLAKSKVSTYLIDNYADKSLIQENIEGIQQLAAAYFAQEFEKYEKSLKSDEAGLSYTDWLDQNFNSIVETFEASVLDALETDANTMQAVMEGWDRLSNFKGADEVRKYFGQYGIEEDAVEAIVSQYTNLRDSVEENIWNAVDASKLSKTNQTLIKTFFNKNDTVELGSEYASIILDAIKTTNAYANRGLTYQAQAYEDAAVSVFREIAKISDSETQEALYTRAFKDIDFTSIESLRDTISSVTAYAEANDKAKEVAPLLAALNAAVETIPSNIFTLAEQLTSTISSEAKDFQKVLDSAAKGMSFEDAIESVQKLSLTEAGAGKTFNELVEYNVELDKWVYTQDGFKAVLEQNRKKVQEAREDFEQKRIQVKETTSAIADNLSAISEELPEDLTTENLGSYAQTLSKNYGLDASQVELILSNYLTSGKASFEEFWAEYLNNIKLAEDGANEQFIAWQKNQVLTFLKAIDFSKLSLGDQYSKGELTAILEEYFKDTEVNVERIVKGLIEGIIPPELVDALDFSTKQKITTARASAYGTAISELLEGPGAQISETTQMVLAQEGKASNLLDDSQTKLDKTSSDLIFAAIDLYKIIADKNQSTKEELNNYAAEILNSARALTLEGRQFEASQLISSRSFSIDELKDFATSTDRLLTDFIDIKTRKITEQYENYLTYDKATGKVKVKPDVSYAELLKTISGGITFSLDNATEEQLEAYSNFVDASIKEQTAKGSTQASQIQSIISAKVGDLINVSYLNTELSEILEDTSGYLNDGILTIADQAVQYNVLSAIASMDAGEDSELQQAIYSARDALITMMQNWANLIKKGFEGTLGAADAATLQSQFGLSEIDFTETAQGLKLSEQAAISVYTQLKQIDSIQAELAFKELSDGLKSANKNYDDISSILARIAELREKIINADKKVDKGRLDQYKRELSVAEEILKTRSSTDPESFKFMDNKLPTSMQGPQNYWDAVGKAYTAINEAGKDGYMDIEAYYNIVNEMRDMVIASNGQLEIMGMTSENAAEHAAELITKGMSALKNIDGKGVKISLAELGTDFVTGTQGMKGGLDKGVKEMARQQIKMLDAAINMLKALVAFEDLSVDADKNGILSFGEVFDTESGQLNSNTQKWIESIDEAAGGIKIGGQTLLEAITDLAGEDKDPHKVVELLNNLINIDFTLGDAEVFKQIMQVISEAFGVPATSGSKVFDILGLLPSAEQTDEFEEELNKLGLDYAKYEKLKDAILNDDWTEVKQDETLSAYVSKKLGAETFDNLTGEDTLASIAARIGLQYDVEWSGKDGAFSGTYIDSSGTEHQLSNRPDMWEKEISIFESQVIKDSGEAAAEEIEYDIKLANSVRLGLTQAFEAKDFRDNLAASIFDAIIAAITKVAGMNFGAEAVGQKVGEEISNGAEVQGPQLPQAQPQGNNQFLNVTIQTNTNTDGVIAEVINNGSQLTDLTQNINVVTTHTASEETPTDSNITKNVNTSFNADTSGLDAAVIKIAQAATQAATNIEKVAAALNKINDKSTEVSNTAKAIDKLHSKEIKATVDAQIDVNVATTLTGNVPAVAKGTIISKRKNVNLTANAKGTHSAIGGNTLMGELGPELVVSDGHYYTVGNNGAEMVNLPKDAIVFNHKQTAELMRKGSISGRGEAVTSEKNAISFAKGTGPAMASAKDALAQLEAIRAMWQAMLEASPKELGSMAGKGGKGGGSGKGGGGGSGSDSAYLGDLERWYNLLRQIENLEEKITLEEAKRKTYVNGLRKEGYEYSKSLQKELDYLRKQQKAQKELNVLRREWYDIRRRELAESDYSKIFTFDEEGLMQYTSGKNRGLDLLATLNQTDIYGKPAMTAKQQVSYLKSLGFDIEAMRYGDDGKQVKSSDYAGIIKNFWSNVDNFMDELDGLWDDVANGLKDVEENQVKQNELLEDVRSNRLEVEDKIFNAIVDLRQATIDALQDQLDATKEAGDKYVSGLKDALSKEREMYSQQQTNNETASLQARLAILQRTGGSAAEIKQLQDQLSSRYQDAYFKAQEDSIESTEEALNNQIEQLQEQIDLQTEILEYQKEHGLLWEEVYDMMNNWDVDSIASFITNNTKEYWDDSPVAAEKTLEEVLLKVQRTASIEEIQLLKEIKEELAVKATDTETPSGYYTRDGKYYHDKEEISKEDYENAMKQAEYDRKWYSQYLDKLESQTKVAELQSAAMTAENTLTLAEDFLEQIQEDYGAASQEYKDLSTLISGTTSSTTAKNALKNVQAMLSGTGKYAGQGYGEKFSGALTGVSSYKQVKTGLANISSSAYGAFTTAIERDIGYQQSLLGEESTSQVIKAPVAMSAYEEPERKHVVASYQSSTSSKMEKKKVPAGTTLVIDGFAGQSARDQFRATWTDAKGQPRTGYFKLGTSDAEKALLAEWKKLPAVPQYLHGGMVDFTGPAWVDGSKKKPEAFLSAEDTALLKSKLFSDSEYSLKSIIDSIRGIQASANATSNLGNNESFVFENVTLNIGSGTIANDYDARRAGQMVIEEMTRIARKTGNLSINRR